MPDFLIFILVFIALLGPLMIIHELGHFWGAKAAGVRVEEFGLGFPPRALKLFERSGTIYSLNWLPIGAFVKMTGEDDPSDPHSLAAAPKRWRLITLVAGPVMNFIGAFVIFTLAYMLFATRPLEYQYRILEVNPGSAAAAVGIKPGDAMLSVNTQPMLQRAVYESSEQQRSFNHSPLRDASLAAAGKPVTFIVSRPSDPANLKSAAEQITLNATMPDGLNPEAPLGVRLAYEVVKAERVPYSVPQALGRAGSDFARIVTTIVTLPAEIARRGMSWEQARPVSVIGITQMGVTLIENRDIEGYFPFVWFAGFISFALGMTNLLPLPALDGGRIVFVLIEWIRGKRVDPVRQQWVHGLGFMVLIGLSVLMMILDVVRPVIPSR